ncbi:MAG: hypothetical protein ACLU4J_21045 [Butyricimonas paravirosa]
MFTDACIHDDTSLADPDFSQLSIISQYDTLSVNLSEEFVYKVDVVQRGGEAVDLRVGVCDL